MGRSRRKEEDVEAFLEDLMELSRKHGIYIAGCGCCGSPVLMDRKGWKNSETVATNLGVEKSEYTAKICTKDKES